MNIYNVAKSPCPVLDRGLTLRNEVNHRKLNFLGVTQERKPLLQAKASKAGVPYELWMKAQAPWKPLLQFVESNKEKTDVEKSVSVLKEDREGVYFDREAVHFSKYVDQPFCKLIATTEKEFLDWLMAKVANRELTLQDTDPVEYHYRMFGDRGQRIHYFHGKLYTYEEVFPLEMQEAREAMAKAGNLIDDFYIRNGWTVERFWEVTSTVGKS